MYNYIIVRFGLTDFDILETTTNPLCVNGPVNRITYNDFNGFVFCWFGLSWSIHGLMDFFEHT